MQNRILFASVVALGSFYFLMPEVGASSQETTSSVETPKETTSASPMGENELSYGVSKSDASDAQEGVTETGTTEEEETEEDEPKRTRLSRSDPERYNVGNRKPGDSLKKTPAARVFNVEK